MPLDAVPPRRGAPCGSIGGYDGATGPGRSKQGGSVASYAIGVDFGTASGRAILVDVADGRQLATAVSEYSNGVIDEVLPLDERRVVLPPDWALQDPDDYI